MVAKIKEKVASVKKKAAEKKVVVKTKVAKNTKKITYPQIQRGAEGELVVQLQDFLVRHGSKVKIDGIFGIGTYTAVKAFQKHNGLKVTGVADSKTWDALIAKK